MHATQTFILVQLMSRESAKYSELKPRTMEGSKFTYHLKQLVEIGLVLLDDQTKRYRLTGEGRRMADHFDTEQLDEVVQPAIVVLALVERQPDEWLLAQRHIQPAYGKFGFPHVRFQLGRNLVTEAKRSLHELTGIQAALRYSGHAYITQYRGEELESIVLAHIVSGRFKRGKLQNPTDGYTFKWSEKPDWRSQDMIPSNGDLVNLAKQEPVFFAELVYHL